MEITTSVGRIVWGHPCKAKPKLDDNNLPKLKQDGTPALQWSFGVAFPKADFQASIWPAMHAEASVGFPNGVPGNFAWKYVDGDSIDNKGQPYSLREGYAGCIVLAVSTELQAPPVFKFDGTKYNQVPAEGIKCGDYVSLGLNLKVNVPNKPTQKPSLYVNPQAIELVGYGTEIVGQGGADPMALFAGRQHQLPAGASAMPVGGGGAVGMPGMGMQQPAMGQPQMQPAMGQPQMQPAMGQPQMQPAMGQPQMQPAMGQPQMQPAMGQPAMMPPPAHDFVQNAMGMQQPAMGGMPMMPPR